MKKAIFLGSSDYNKTSLQQISRYFDGYNGINIQVEVKFKKKGSTVASVARTPLPICSRSLCNH